MRSNGFDALRLMAAATVIFGHSYPLTGNVAPGLLANGLQTIAVKVFFVISGYLITKSWQSDANLARFWMKRALRIMPGLICLCMVTVLFVGPLVTTLNLRGYLLNPGARFYFWNLLLYPVYTLPGVFQGNIYGPAVNGSLWTLPVEVLMYCGVPLLIGRRTRVGKIAIPLVAIGLLCASIMFVRLSPPASPTVVWGTSLTSTLDVAFYFYAGSTMAILGFQRFANIPVFVALFTVAALVVNHYVWGEVVLAVTLPWVVISIGTARFRPLARILDGRDYSYGLYLYGFIVQQEVVHMFGPLTPVLNAVISLPVALLCATGSWHLVESGALRFKPATAVARSSLSIDRTIDCR